MKTVRMFVDNKVVIFADIADSVDIGDVVRAMTKTIDRYATTRAEMAVPKAGIGNAWLKFIESFAQANGHESACILSKRRTQPLPELRAIAASAWQEVTNEMVTRIAPRLNMDYSSVIIAIDKINQKGIYDQSLKARHKQAIELCQAIFAPTNNEEE